MRWKEAAMDSRTQKSGSGQRWPSQAEAQRRQPKDWQIKGKNEPENNIARPLFGTAEVSKVIPIRNKKTKTKSISVFGGLLCLALGAGMTGAIKHYYSGPRSVNAAERQTTVPAVIQGLPDFASLAKRIGPSVVNVSTTQVRKAAQDVRRHPSVIKIPWANSGKDFLAAGAVRAGQQRQNGLGSGFIIDSNGTILTNYHVVDGAQKISVVLSDGKTYDAKVIGKDQKTDIAVIKIDAGQALPAVTFGDSDRLEVGEWVMAIGNPFGLDHTVTSGIVSAKGRQIGAGPYDNFIQTDASINPGNSGGPLLNLRGEVVGINTAIFSQSGGNIGIGFAIPTNSIKELLPQLKDKGKVVRGYLGTTVQKITPDIAESMGLKQVRGALVAEVMKNTPAERAGVKTGDIIVGFDGKEIKESSDLPTQVARVAPGTTVQLKVLRDARKSTLPLTVGEMKEKRGRRIGARGGRIGLSG